MIYNSKQTLRALWKAWYELNVIHARDGVPYTRNNGKSSVDYEYFSSVVEECKNVIEECLGKPITPWMPEELQYCVDESK